MKSWLVLAFVCPTLLLLSSGLASAAPAKPNFIVIFVDNFGNGDLRCFNPATPHRTPHVDRLAAEGMKFTSFCVASGVCTPSRVSLITGCHCWSVRGARC